MKIFVYSIYDVDAKEFGPLFQAKNDTVAIRNYKQSLVGVPDEVKASYKLFNLFEIDTESGQFGLPFEKYEVLIDENKESSYVNN